MKYYTYYFDEISVILSEAVGKNASFYHKPKAFELSSDTYKNPGHDSDFSQYER